MTIGVLLAQLAEVDWLSPILRIATRLYLEVRPFALRIDEPKNGCIDRNINVIHGWFICPARNQTISLRLGHVELTWREAEREDVRRIFGSGVRGFRAVVDREVIDGADKSTSLELVVDGATVASKSLRLIYDGATHTETSTRKRAAKREWLKNNVACPACHSKERTLTFTDNEVCCVSCGSSFKDDGKIFNFLPDNFKIQFNISDWGDISVHNYDEEAKEVIADVRRKGGKLLDCGSGLRSEVDEAVVCLEVEAFPNVDILGVNQRLPFPDAVFDAVLSLNVLEHVTDPFACAAE
ncbi:MAG TPA: methyltransferase domain-containing protein, partial [Bryobacteraceae bacterium]|nr:methyltransferase domain-containing protein [Bryobacteraceae bacterium]